VLLDHVQGANVYDSTEIPIGRTISLDLRVQNTSGDNVEGFSAPFVVYSPDGATWTPVLHPPDPKGDTNLYGMYVDPPEVAPLVWCCSVPNMMDYAIKVFTYSDHDNNPGTPDDFGSGVDTVIFAAANAVTGTGIPDGFDYVGVRISLEVTDSLAAGKTICLDTTRLSPWLWAWVTTVGQFTPSWDGPHCFTIVDCCLGMRGNVNGDVADEVNIADLTAYVSWAYQQGPEPPCKTEVDVNGDNSIDTADLSYLVKFMFKNGAAPVTCP
jgi:hypothetical protein